jgi:hypothetical protein
MELEDADGWARPWAGDSGLDCCAASLLIPWFAGRSDGAESWANNLATRIWLPGMWDERISRMACATNEDALALLSARLLAARGDAEREGIVERMAPLFWTAHPEAERPSGSWDREEGEDLATALRLWHLGDGRPPDRFYHSMEDSALHILKKRGYKGPGERMANAAAHRLLEMLTTE